MGVLDLVENNEEYYYRRYLGCLHASIQSQGKPRRKENVAIPIITSLDAIVLNWR